MYNNITRKVRNNNGVRIRVPNFSSTEAFEYLDENYYAPGTYKMCHIMFRVFLSGQF